jgi:hypothetical protein
MHMAQGGNIHPVLIRENILNNQIYSIMSIRGSNAYPLNNDNYTYGGGEQVQSYASDSLYNRLIIQSGIQVNPQNIIRAIIEKILLYLISNNFTTQINNLIDFYKRYFTHLQIGILQEEWYRPFLDFFYKKIVNVPQIHNLDNPLFIRTIIDYLFENRDDLFLDTINFSLINNDMIQYYNSTKPSINIDTFRSFLIHINGSAHGMLLKYNINLAELSLSDLELLTYRDPEDDAYKVFNQYIKQHERNMFDRLVALWIESIVDKPESRFDRFITAILGLVNNYGLSAITKRDIYQTYIFSFLKNKFDTYLMSSEHIRYHTRLMNDSNYSYINLFAEIMSRLTLSMVNIETAAHIIADIFTKNNIKAIPTQANINQIFEFNNYKFELKYLKYKQKYLELKNKTKK